VRIEQDGTAAESGRGQVPLFCLALGALWAAMPIFSSRDLVVDSFLTSYPTQLFLAWAVFFVANGLGYFLLYGFRDLVVPVHAQRRLLLSSTAVAGCGAVLSAVSGAGGIPAWCHSLGLAILGIGLSPLAMLCGELLGVIDARKASLIIPLSIMVTGCGLALRCLLRMLSFWLGMVSCMMLVIVTLVAGVGSWQTRLTPVWCRVALVDRAAGQQLKMSIRPTFGLVAYGMALGLMLSLCLRPAWLSPNSLLVLSGGVALAACSLFLVNHFASLAANVELFFKLISPTVVGALLLATFFKQDVSPLLLVFLAAIVWSNQVILLITLSSRIASELSMPGMLTFCRMAGFHSLGTGVGVGVWVLLYALGGVEARALPVICGITVLLLIFAAVFSLNEPTSAITWGLIPVERVGSLANAERELSAQLETIGDEHNLTKREKEVLLVLARGRNAQFIATELVISIHTAKTHIKHIYHKMGVHTQQELLDAIDTIGANLTGSDA
jgi:DNA-binding CsgD family transcriptional regulator